MSTVRSSSRRPTTSTRRKRTKAKADVSQTTKASKTKKSQQVVQVQDGVDVKTQIKAPDADQGPAKGDHQATDANPRLLTQILSHKITEKIEKTVVSHGGTRPGARLDPRHTHLLLDRDVGAAVLINGRTGEVEKAVVRKGFNMRKLRLSDYPQLKGITKGLKDKNVIDADVDNIRLIDKTDGQFTWGDPVVVWSFDKQGKRIETDVDVNPKGELTEVTKWVDRSGNPISPSGSRTSDPNRNSQTVVSHPNDTQRVVVDNDGLGLALEAKLAPGQWIDDKIPKGKIELTLGENMIREAGAKLTVEVTGSKAKTTVQIDRDDGTLEGNDAKSKTASINGHSLRSILGQTVKLTSRSTPTGKHDERIEHYTVQSFVERQRAKGGQVAGMKATDSVLTPLFIKSRIPTSALSVTKERLSDSGQRLRVEVDPSLLQAKDGGSVEGWRIDVGAIVDGEWQGKTLTVAEGHKAIGAETFSIDVPDAAKAVIKNYPFEMRVFDADGFPVIRAKQLYSEIGWNVE